MSVTQTSPSSRTTVAGADAPADSAADLLNAMAAMPSGHPSRAQLRDSAIEAWLPLARHLANRYSG
ncbi:RNA polymerase sigma factor SigF, partial [Paractinoplanes globisporus]